MAEGSMRFEPTPDLLSRASRLASDLRDEAQELRDAFDEKPEEFQESDDGDVVIVLLDTMNDLADELDSLS